MNSKDIIEGDYIKNVNMRSNIYIVLNVDKDAKKVLVKNISDSKVTKLKLFACYKVQKNGEIFNMPNVKQQRNRNPRNLKVNDTVCFKDSKEQYSIVQTNIRSCWIKSINDPSLILRSIEYYKLELISKSTEKKVTINEPKKKNNYFDGNVTGKVLLKLSSNRTIEFELKDYEIINTVEVEKIYKKKYRL